MMITRQLLPDGGKALLEQKVRLPERITMTEGTVMCQPLEEAEPGRCLIGQDFFGYFFSFSVPMTADQVRAYFQRETALTLANFRPGPERLSVVTVERFRDVYCDVVEPKGQFQRPVTTDPNDNAASG